MRELEIKPVIAYQCPICKQLHTDENEIKKCLVHHLGTTMDVYNEWEKLGEWSKENDKETNLDKRRLVSNEIIKATIVFLNETSFNPLEVVNKEPLKLAKM